MSAGATDFAVFWAFVLFGLMNFAVWKILEVLREILAELKKTDPPKPKIERGKYL